MLDSVSVQAPGPAPSSSVAAAARAFGDDYPPVRRQWQIGLAGLLLVLTTFLYTPWMLWSLNDHAPWLAWPFAIANLFSMGYGLLAVFNAWSRKVPEPRTIALGDEPQVGIIIPTCGEPVPMILRTIASVLEQDWPADRLTVLVSDDGHDPELEAAMASLPVLYHSPPGRFAPGREGAAKAGNLNAALALLDAEHPHIRYIETRDADDEVGSNAFLRHTVGQLEADATLAFVQTVKQAQVSAGDPFNNWEPMFYRGQMLARNAADAVFPCGSGLVWRRTALREIGDFPTWNLVEDVHSGLEALRLGWHGMYLPIVGAVAQHAPEDIPNFYKQRGTWAIDTVRLMVWRRLKGLSLRQKAQFWEMLAFYLNAFTAFIYIPSVAFSLLGTSVLVASATGYLTHLLPVVLAVEAWLLVLNLPYNDRRRRQRKLVRKLWQTRVMWTGMAPVYAKAVLLAILGGPNRKPTYSPDPLSAVSTIPLDEPHTIRTPRKRAIDRWALFILASAATFGATLLGQSAPAVARVSELGAPATPIVAPDCPQGVSASDCTIVLTRSTALAMRRDGIANPATATARGSIIGFAVGLSALPSDPSVRQPDVRYLNATYGGARGSASRASAPTGVVPSSGGGFVTERGGRLYLNGNPYTFVGFNFNPLNRTDNPSLFHCAYQDPSYDQTLADWQLGSSNAVDRIWAFQSWATTTDTHRRTWTVLDQSLATLAAHHMKAILTLTDEWGACEYERGRGTNGIKTEAWFDPRSTPPNYAVGVDPGNATTYRQYVHDLAARYANNPTVLAYELGNEIDGGTNGVCSPTGVRTMTSFVNDMVATIHSVDTHHLLMSGMSIGGDPCSPGTADSGDMCSWHDYGEPLVNLPSQLVTEINDCKAAGKALVVGEDGISVAGDARIHTLRGRASALSGQLSHMFPAGIAGYLGWEWDDASVVGSPPDLAVTSGDPELPILGQYGRKVRHKGNGRRQERRQRSAARSRARAPTP